MKNFILFSLVLFVTTLSFGQTTQKYNSILDRIEFYDSRGNLTGYAKENSILKRTEYYDERGNLVKYEKK